MHSEAKRLCRQTLSIITHRKNVKGNQHANIWVKNCQTELMVEIYFKGLVRAIGKAYNLARITIKTHKGDEKCLLWWSPSVTLEKNNDVLRLLAIFLILCFTTYLSLPN